MWNETLAHSLKRKRFVFIISKRNSLLFFIILYIYIYIIALLSSVEFLLGLHTFAHSKDERQVSKIIPNCTS